MAIIPSTTSLTSGVTSSTPTVPSVSVSALKGPPATKIDLTTGKGVPGGFSASSVKSPTAEVSKLKAAQSAISAKKASVAAAIANKTPGVNMSHLKKLDNMQAATTTKLKAAAKAPDFSKKVTLSKPPAQPATPDFKSAGIPDVPNVTTPTTSGASISTPSIPKT